MSYRPNSSLARDDEWERLILLNRKFSKRNWERVAQGIINR
jgi:hypothetical protein